MEVLTPFGTISLQMQRVSMCTIWYIISKEQLITTYSDHQFCVVISRLLKPEVSPWPRTGLLDRGQIHLLLYLYHLINYLSYGLTIYYLTTQLLFTLLLILISYIIQLSLQTVLKPHLLFATPQVLYFFVWRLRWAIPLHMYWLHKLLT